MKGLFCWKLDTLNNSESAIVNQADRYSLVKIRSYGIHTSSSVAFYGIKKYLKYRYFHLELCPYFIMDSMPNELYIGSGLAVINKSK